MKQILMYILLLLSTTLFSQISGLIVNAKTNQVIAYVNISIENNNLGATSNEKGVFTLNIKDKSAIIIFSAIGYETKKIIVTNLNKVIKLTPKTIKLPEVVIYLKKETKELSIDKFNKSKYNYYNSAAFRIMAKYFPYEKKYSNTPLLKTFRILTKSKVKDAKFNIRLYTKGLDGKPAKYLHNQNILCIAKKGKKYTEIDVSTLNIKFPKEGFFIAIEWLLIEQNKNVYTYTIEDSNKKHKGINFNPSIGLLPKDTFKNSYLFYNDTWNEYNYKNNQNHPLKKYQNKYNEMAIELILTN